VNRIVEEHVRTVARELERRHGEYVDAETLAADEEFEHAAQVLANEPFETSARLARVSSPELVAEIALRAIELRQLVPETWLRWVLGRLTLAYARELTFLLAALERHATPPLLALVLAAADDDWTDDPILSVISEFVRRRVSAGDGATPDDFAATVASEREEIVSNTVEALVDVLPPDVVAAFEAWRRSKVDVDFFKSLGRVWEPGSEPLPLTTVGGRATAVAALESALQRPRPHSILLVGEHGVGKTAVLRDVLGRLHEEGWFLFEAGAAEVNAGQSYIGQLEGRVRDIVRRMEGRRVVWVLPAFEEALWTGQHARNPHGLLDALLPFVEARQVVIVGELEPAAYELLVQHRPRITSLFGTLRLPPLTPEETLEVARDWRDQVGAAVDDETIRESYELAAHYLAGVAAPANVLRLLKATRRRLHQDGRDGRLTTHDVLETLSEASGLPLHVVDPHTPLELDEVREFFAARVLGQAEAVECLVERIALIKAGLTDPTRPLGVFLFVGPTGTGKTEIAKALARFLFGAEDRLVRLDMSEFKTSDSFERLLAASDAHAERALLIPAVRAQPFSVVLLDEFEKAHRNVWDLFLQVFDDGRLTDSRGRTTDFRQCVIILTSNLGAAVGRGVSVGFGSGGDPYFSPAAVERTVGQVFRPEFLNRLDRVVVFRPFERRQMRALLEKELAQVLERRGFRMRPWAVEWDEAALECLIEKGFSAELGARPLKRAIEQHLLAPLARTIVSRRLPEGEQFLFITARNDRIDVAFVDPDADEPPPPATAPPTALRLEALVVDPKGSEDEVAFLRTETERLRQALEGEAWQLQKEADLAATREPAFWESRDRFETLARIEYADRVQAAFRTAENLLARLSRTRTNGQRPARRLIELLAERLYLLDRAAAGLATGHAADAFLALRAGSGDAAGAEFARRLGEMYEAWGRKRGMRVRRLGAGAADGELLYAVSGIAAYTILAPEAGLHVLEVAQRNRQFDRVSVHVVVAPRPAAPPEADPDEEARTALAATAPSQAVVRRYRTDPSPLVRDSVREWRTGRLDRVLGGDFDVIAER
jgi:ATP-dependent Clp protease ATP-binding subunit ClpC